MLAACLAASIVAWYWGPSWWGKNIVLGVGVTPWDASASSFTRRGRRYREVALEFPALGGHIVIQIVILLPFFACPFWYKNILQELAVSAGAFLSHTNMTMLREG